MVKLEFDNNRLFKYAEEYDVYDPREEKKRRAPKEKAVGYIVSMKDPD